MQQTAREIATLVSTDAATTSAKAAPGTGPVVLSLQDLDNVSGGLPKGGWQAAGGGHEGDLPKGGW
jgi:hypothetical protein